MARPTGRDIRNEVLTATRRSMQARGMAGCNYSELARMLGVRAPSIHHHFATRNELARVTTERYCDDFERRIATIDDENPVAALREYVEVFLSPAHDGLLCLCGAVAADWTAVDGQLRDRIERFFAGQLAWLTERFADGIQVGVIVDRVRADRMAASMFSTLEGALLVAGTGVVADEVLDGATALIDLALVSA